MSETEPRVWIGIAVLVVAGALLITPNVASVPYSGVVNAVSVLGLAAGAALVGTAGEERPV
jgi:hypothetical protein